MLEIAAMILAWKYDGNRSKRGGASGFQNLSHDRVVCRSTIRRTGKIRRFYGSVHVGRSAESDELEKLQLAVDNFAPCAAKSYPGYLRGTIMKSLAVFLFFAFSIEAHAYSQDLKPTIISSPSRRGLFQNLIAAATTTAFVTRVSPAAAASTSLFNDPTHGFSIQVPSDWTASTQRLPDRRQMRVWQDPLDQQTLLFIAYTPVRDDFTSLGSFGSVEVVAEQTIMPKGQLAGAVDQVSSRLVSAKSEKQAYFFDYVQCVSGVTQETHYRTIFTLAQGATGGAGSVLVTATIQAPESRYEQLQPLFDQIIDSYGKSKEA